MTDAASAEAIHQALIGLGYQCLHRSADAANYQRSDERVDFIFAHRTAAIRMLSSAPALQTAFGEIRVVTTEALIGLKLQGFVNDPRRTQDLEDIRALIAANRAELKLDEVRAFPSVQLRNSPRGAAQVSTPANPDLPFVRDGGLPHTSTATTRDPFEALDDLMTVVEALCPTWPDRETFSSSATFFLDLNARGAPARRSAGETPAGIQVVFGPQSTAHPFQVVSHHSVTNLRRVSVHSNPCSSFHPSGMR